MANKVKKRKPARKFAPLSRTDLLPMAPAQVQNQSLRTHMALVTIRSGHGDLGLFGELLRTVFVTYFVCKTEGGVPCFEDFVDAERALKAGMDSGEADGIWEVDHKGAAAIETVLSIQDEQLSHRPSYRIERAKDRLRTILDTGAFPDLAHEYDIAHGRETSISEISHPHHDEENRI